MDFNAKAQTKKPKTLDIVPDPKQNPQKIINLKKNSEKLQNLADKAVIKKIEDTVEQKVEKKIEKKLDDKVKQKVEEEVVKIEKEKVGNLYKKATGFLQTIKKEEKRVIDKEKII